MQQEIINSIELGLLRRSMTFIPQEPFLMDGTLRYNIDPLNMYSDSDIKEVMKKIDFEYQTITINKIKIKTKGLILSIKPLFT